MSNRTCHVCEGKRPAVENCAACVGRGRIDQIGFCATPWSEVHPGLHVGGHDRAWQVGDEHGWFGSAPVIVSDEFDTVISLYQREGHGPHESVEHHHYRMADSSLRGEDLEAVDRLAAIAAERVAEGKKVLVRCQAGLNRSSLVAALALVKLGHTPDAAIDLIRKGRDQNCLFNRSFVAHIRTQTPGTPTAS